MRCGMDPAGGNRREARGDLCSCFLKARFSQLADSVNMFTSSLEYHFWLFHVALPDVCGGVPVGTAHLATLRTQ